MKNLLIVVIGAYGSGKSEYSINLAKEYRNKNFKTTLIDLDVVNPYFRSRDVREDFQKQREKLSAEITSSRVRINKLSKELEKAEKSRQKLQKKLKEFQENEYYFGDIKSKSKVKDSKN